MASQYMARVLHPGECKCSELTDALVPVDVLYETNWTLAAISSRQVDTSILAHLFISAFIKVLA